MSADYELARSLLRHPCVFFAEAKSLRDVLALVHGVAVGKYPPHGSGWLPGFSEFIRLRFNAPRRAEYITLLEQFGHLSRAEGCAAVLTLLDEWQASEGTDAIVVKAGQSGSDSK